MSTAFAESEAGREWLIRAARAGMAVAQSWARPLIGFLPQPDDRWPHWVHYRARRGRTYYCSPDRFGFLGGYSLTDSDWMVPGTNKTDNH